MVGLGIGLILVSRGGEAAASPKIGEHWHAAYGVYTCGEFQPPMVDGDQGDQTGIHTHGDGLIHIHPFSTQVTGEGADLDAFGNTVGMELDDDSITLPDGQTFTNGDDCGGQPGQVQVKVWDAGSPDGRLLDSDFSSFAPQNGDLVTIAFAPEGTDLPQPPSTGTQPTDIETPAAPGQESVPVDPTVPETGATTTPPTGATTVPPAGDTATTVAP